MITEEELKQALNVEHYGTSHDGGTKTFKIIGENIGIKLYSTNSASWITEEMMRDVNIFIVDSDLTRWEYKGKLDSTEELLVIINKLKSLL